MTLNYGLSVPKEHVDTMEVLREALYLMSGMENSPDYANFWEFRSRLFRPLMDEIRVGTRRGMHSVLEKWLLRQATTEETMESLKKLEDEYGA